MLELSNDDLITIGDGWYHDVRKVVLGDKSYYAKFCGDTEAFRELIGKKIFDMVGIECANYHFVKKKHIVLSEDIYEKYPNFKLASEFGNIVCLDDLFNVIKQFKNYEELFLRVNIVYIIDTMFANEDRHKNNYGFSINDDGSAKLVVFDNGLLLAEYENAIRPISFPSDDFYKFMFYSRQAGYKYYLENCNEEIKDLINYYFSKFDINTVYLMMKSIERENGYKFKCKRNLILRYIKNYIILYGLTKKDEKRKKLR